MPAVKKHKNTISLKKIADEVGLAEGTVSRILKGTDQCAVKTRERVLKLASKYKYRPNLLVQGMQSGRTKTIGVMLPMYMEFFGQILSGVHDELAANDHVPIVLWSYDELVALGEKKEETEMQQIFRLIDRRVDGVILWPFDEFLTDEHYHEILDRGLPLIAVDRELDHARADFVGADDEQMGRLVAEHFLALGHRNCGHIAGSDTVATGRRRRRGFESTLRKAGASCQTVVVNDFLHGHDAARELLSVKNRPTAVFTVTDIIGAQTYQVAKELGISIPGDLSVAGCSNLSIGSLLNPPITTVEHNPIEIGKSAVRLLMERLRESDLVLDLDLDKDKDTIRVPRKVILPSSLIPRESTAPLNSR